MKRRYICALTIIIVILIIGLHQKDVTLFKFEEKEQYSIEIESEPEEKNYYNMYNGKVDGKKILLYIPKRYEKLTYKDKIEVKATFEEPQKARNSGGFDYSLYLKSKKIYGTLKVEEILKITKAKEIPIINKIQKNIKENFKKNLKEENANLAIRITIR